MKKILFAILLGATLTACDDDTAMIGNGLMPDNDRITAIDSCLTSQPLRLNKRLCWLTQVRATWEASSIPK